MLTLIYVKTPEQITINLPEPKTLPIKTLPVETLEAIEAQEQDWLCRDTYYRDDNYY